MILWSAQIGERIELGQIFYHVSNTLLTQDSRIQVLGEGSSGEIEPLLVRSGGVTYFGLASDHTDRNLEAHSVAASKQICAKPIASKLWNLADISDHLDDITMKCWIEEDGIVVLYQDGTLAQIRPLSELCNGAGFTDGTAILCGTFATIGGVRAASSYRMEVSDPHTGKTITLSYSVLSLRVVS